MQPSDIDFLRHILQETMYCLSELHTMNRDDLFTNGRLSRALVRSLEIIGEASKKIHPDIKSKYPFIDWFKITGLRNRLVHEYFGIDYDIVWQNTGKRNHPFERKHRDHNQSRNLLTPILFPIS